MATTPEDDGDVISKTSTPSPTTNTSPSTAVNNVNGIKNDSLEEHSSDEISVNGTPLQDPETYLDDQKDLQFSPELSPDTENEDEEEELEEEEELSPKKQNQEQLPELPKPELEIANVPLTENGKPSKTAKKSKKRKSKDVWSTTSRKGRKKTKHVAVNNNVDIEDKVLITPIPRFPDKSDDNPDLKICLSKIYKAEKVELSDDRLTAGSTKGYRMVRATRGVTNGAWYYEVKVMYLGESGHTRIGWSTEKGDLQAPVGYDGNSFGYRDVDGSKVHKALREKYGDEGYKEGDVIGFYINLPDGESYAPEPPRLVWYKGQRYSCAPNEKADSIEVVPGSEIAYYKNGICQGVAFKDLYGGRYYPAASMYTLPNQPNCVVKFNFGPDFERFPDNFGDRPFPQPMIEVPYQIYDGRVDNNESNEKKL